MGQDTAAVGPKRWTSRRRRGTFTFDHHDGICQGAMMRLSERTRRHSGLGGVRGRTVSSRSAVRDVTTNHPSRTLPVRDGHHQEVLPRRLSAIGRGRFRLGRSADSGSDGTTRRNDRSGEQLTLDAPEQGWRDADLAADQALSRFGTSAIRAGQPANVKAPEDSPETRLRYFQSEVNKDICLQQWNR